MNTKRFIILPVLVLTFGWALGQNDVVHLNNGSVIRGTISEYIVKDHVRIKTEEGKYYEYPDSEVKKVSFDGAKLAFSLKEKGYYNVTSLGVLLGINQWGDIAAQPSLQVVQGFHFKGRMNVGIGTGLELVRYQPSLPLFGEFRYHLKKDRFSPYVAANAGYGFILGNSRNYYFGGEYKSKGGILGGMHVGIRNFARRDLGWNFSVGYRFQQMREAYSYAIQNPLTDVISMVPVTERTSMHRFEMRFGIVFN